MIPTIGQSGKGKTIQILEGSVSASGSVVEEGGMNRLSTEDF